MERNKEVIKALVKDGLEQHPETTENIGPGTSLVESECAEDVGYIAPLPLMSDIVSQFHVTENIPFDNSVAGVVSSLRRARRAFKKANQEKRGSTRQLLLTALFDQTDQ